MLFRILSLSFLFVACGVLEKPEDGKSATCMVEQVDGGALVKCQDGAGKVTETLVKNGEAGRNGPMGPRGPQGPTGEQGPSGEMLKIYETTSCAGMVGDSRITFKHYLFETMDAFVSVHNEYMRQNEVMFQRNAASFFPQGSVVVKLADGIFTYELKQNGLLATPTGGEAKTIPCEVMKHG